MYPEELKYSKAHEWAKIEGNITTIGISFYAQEQMGDIVFADLPEVGRTVQKDDPFGVVESVKAVSDVFSPVGGKIIKVNTELIDTPELINQDPYGKGWMIAVEMSDPGEVDSLMSAAEYEEFLAQQST